MQKIDYKELAKRLAIRGIRGYKQRFIQEEDLLNGEDIMIPGTLKGTKAIGWFIDEYGIAQVSMNITDIKTTPLHVAFDEVSRCAANRGLRVTGAKSMVVSISAQ